MKHNILINVEKKEYIDAYRKAGITAFLFALKDFCVGYQTFDIEDIIEADVPNKYILINRVLNSNDIDKLKEIIELFKGIKGIVFEDIGVYNVIKELNKDLELILFQNHFCTNSSSINFWLNRVDSTFVSNEITKEEIENILSNTKKPVVLHLFGYNQVMYSRRKLLSNWCENFELENRSEMLITDKATKVKFRAMENEYGTVMYSENIYDGRELLNKDNVKYYYINTTMIPHDSILSLLKDIDNYHIGGTDKGFLYRETIYKLKER